MNHKINLSLGLCWGVVLLGLLSGLVFPAQQKKPSGPVTISAYDIYEQRLKQPMTVMDIRGVKKTTEKIYIVELKGEFDEPGAIPVDIFIGDYKVPEYGGTKEGIYFKIYDGELLQRLEAKPFGYGYKDQKIKTFKLKFKPSLLKPFKIVKKDTQ